MTTPHDATMNDSAHDRAVALSFAHRVRFTRRALDPANHALRAVLAGDEAIAARRAIVFVDEGVAAAQPRVAEQLRAYFDAHRAHMPRIVAVETCAGGERAKEDMRLVDRVIELVEREKIDRKSFVFAIGGGAMLDAVGLGAATAHRGVRLVRLPTTTLAQDDAAMGVKNGVNRFGKKNFVGAFAVPHAVVCDESMLSTCSARVSARRSRSRF